MREIKFRAWDLRNDRMVQDPYVFNEITAGHYVKEYGATYVFYETWQDVGDGIDRPCHIMQYTGLVDKNGKEIYESDVIRWRFVNTGEDEEYYEEEVKWYECGFFLDGGAPLTVAMDDCEVIGNVHQNPEILNQ